METKIWVAGVIAAACMGCGDDEGGKTAANNGTNGAPNNAIVGGWTATVTDSEVEFPDVESGPPVMTSVANRYTIVGAYENGAVSMTLELEFAGGDAVEGELAPRRFVLQYGLPVDAEPADRTSYVCSHADGFMVSVTGTDPLRGTYAGPLTCAPQDLPMDTFGAQVTGAFTVFD